MGGFARDVARLFSPGGLTYSHIAHMEALLRADRFFGVFLLLLRVTEASFLAAFILAGGVATTFELFTHEWLNNPVRVKAAQEARRLAGIAGGRASAAASDARASALGVRSARTGRPDGMGMNIGGGYEKVKKEAAALDISADEYSRAKRGDAGFRGATASDARASALGVRCSRTDRPDGMGINLAGGYEQVKKEAAALDISADEYTRAKRMAGTEAAALANRGRSNLNLGTPRNDAVLQLGEQIGSAVMGEKVWAKYILTSAKDMPPQNKPFTVNETNRSAQARPADERDGWVFLPEKRTVSLGWSMTGEITYRLPDHTEYTESFRAAISQAYHRSWGRHSRMERKNQQDNDAGKLLPRGHR